MTQNLHVCMICFRPEEVYVVISGLNVKTIEGYLVVCFEVASSNSSPDIKKIISFMTAEAATTEIDDSIKRKCFRVSLKNVKW